MSLANKLDAAGLSMTPDAEGKNLFLLGSSSMRKMSLPGAKMERITVSGTRKNNPVASENISMTTYSGRGCTL